jgi:hypothetical protein
MTTAVPNPMTPAEYAAVERELGAKVVERGGVFWRQVRPFFYRPVLPTQEFSTAQISRPFSWPNGFQFALTDQPAANSQVNFIMLDGLREYSPDQLGRRRKQLVRAASQIFQVRPLRDLREFKEQGYRAYRSFYDRTGYAHRADRKDEKTFHGWAEKVFSHPKAILLGGYGAEGLLGVSRSYLVGKTLVYATLFCETEALKKNIGELMFHELRMLAAGDARIAEIYVRNYQAGNSLDQYYLLRGCKLVSKPAHLVLPAGIGAAVKIFLPRQHAMLTGKIVSAAPAAAPE